MKKRRSLKKKKKKVYFKNLLTFCAYRGPKVIMFFPDFQAIGPIGGIL